MRDAERQRTGESGPRSRSASRGSSRLPRQRRRVRPRSRSSCRGWPDHGPTPRSAASTRRTASLDLVARVRVREDEPAVPEVCVFDGQAEHPRPRAECPDQDRRAVGRGPRGWSTARAARWKWPSKSTVPPRRSGWMIWSASSNRPTGWSSRKPNRSCSLQWSPARSPRMTRPPLISSTVSAILARSAGLRYPAQVTRVPSSTLRGRNGQTGQDRPRLPRGPSGVASGSKASGFPPLAGRLPCLVHREMVGHPQRVEADRLGQPRVGEDGRPAHRVRATTVGPAREDPSRRSDRRHQTDLERTVARRRTPGGLVGHGPQPRSVPAGMPRARVRDIADLGRALLDQAREVLAPAVDLDLEVASAPARCAWPAPA